jgi:hypothetical protein
LIPGVQDLLLTPGFGTLFKLWVVVFGMSILGYHPGFFKNFFKILFLIVQAGRDGWMDGWMDRYLSTNSDLFFANVDKDEVGL